MESPSKKRGPSTTRDTSASQSSLPRSGKRKQCDSAPDSSNEPTLKRIKEGKPEDKKLHATVQNAMYAQERLMHSPSITHVITKLIEGALALFYSR